jgi:antitoxin ParD1/3/4
VDTMNIALPAAMKEFVHAQVEEGRYSSVSEYVRQLIRADQQQKAREEIDRKLLEALDGGPAAAWTAGSRGALKSRVRQRRSKRRSAR